MNTEKQCRRCLECKPSTDFTRVGDALHSYCKPCRVQIQILGRNRRKAERMAEARAALRPDYYADSVQGQRYRTFQSMLNDVPAYARGNLCPVVRSCIAEAA